MLGAIVEGEGKSGSIGTRLAKDDPGVTVEMIRIVPRDIRILGVKEHGRVSTHGVLKAHYASAFRAAV